ncbi:MoaD/ThiS family protein [Candidatus Woesearchaeota archaeon]|nr:MoaD/ThiS family protein [Candidatus Woesearchaeota archaeon]
MKLTIKLEKPKNTKRISFSKKTVQELLLQLNINPQTVLIVRNNQVITEDEKLKDGDTLELLSVVSGG